ncbi:MAG: hypothetical protein ACE5JU_18030 [Candidatus Binatia bacterium]
MQREGREQGSGLWGKSTEGEMMGTACMAGRCYILLLFSLVPLLSCSSGGVMLVHPKGGSIIRCGAVGVGSIGTFVGSFGEACIKRYEGLGYIPVEKLTPEQRADLEGRGVLSKQ